MSNLLRSIQHTVQNWKLKKLAKKSGVAPRNLPAIFRNNPTIVNLVLLEINEDNEMPALLFDWNNSGFNDTGVAGCRNGVPAQTKAAVIANLVANGATNYKNKDILFTFRNGDSIGTWSLNVDTNLAWAKNQPGVANITNSVIRINKITASTAVVDLEGYDHIFR